MEDAPKRELLSKETRDLFALGARLITDDWVKYKVMCDLAGISTLDEALHRTYATVNWSDRTSILPIIPTLEFIYSKTPNTMLRLPQKLDEALARDGYGMKKGKLVRLNSERYYDQNVNTGSLGHCLELKVFTFSISIRKPLYSPYQSFAG